MLNQVIHSSLNTYTYILIEIKEEFKARFVSAHELQYWGASGHKNMKNAEKHPKISGEIGNIFYHNFELIVVWSKCFRSFICSENKKSETAFYIVTSLLSESFCIRLILIELHHQVFFLNKLKQSMIIYRYLMNIIIMFSCHSINAANLQWLIMNCYLKILSSSLDLDGAWWNIKFSSVW